MQETNSNNMEYDDLSRLDRPRTFRPSGKKKLIIALMSTFMVVAAGLGITAFILVKSQTVENYATISTTASIVSDDGTSTLLAESHYNYDENSVSENYFANQNISLLKTAQLEYSYTIKNVSDGELLLTIRLTDLEFTNISYYLVIGEAKYGFTDRYTLSLGEDKTTTIKFIARVNNVASSANMDGKLSLDISKMETGE